MLRSENQNGKCESDGRFADKGEHWAYSALHKKICRVIQRQEIWGHDISRVWFPSEDRVERVPSSSLMKVDDENAGYGKLLISETQDAAELASKYIIYTSTAARIAQELRKDMLMAPIESSVIPLPHQLRALKKAMGSENTRFLLADEVGLGKTIEAGLIMKEMKMRGLVGRTLVVAPKGLVTQWVSELKTHFNEDFKLILPQDIKYLNSMKYSYPENDLKHKANQSQTKNGDSQNPWSLFNQVVVPLDSFKPLEKRAGWDKPRIDQYNRERFDDLISAGWDLVIVDEAHRLAGSTDRIARFRLGRGLADVAPNILLLTATPHQGKTDAFHRLISLIDEKEFADAASIKRHKIAPYVIRTEKAKAIDAEGEPLFKPRKTKLEPISWKEHHEDQKLLYEAVTEYVREGYNQAIKEKRTHIGFLLLLMQRLVVSSTCAIKATLKRRLEVLKAESREMTQLQLLTEEELDALEEISEEEFFDMDGQRQQNILTKSHLKALGNEREEVAFLLDLAKRCVARGPDAKAETLLDCIYELQTKKRDPSLKVLIFTEFIDTQKMLRAFLEERGFNVAYINGDMRMDERLEMQKEFAGDAQIMVSTDAGGEGLNLQFCHTVINYDIPWNPMRLEQRIGRVDRIGQRHNVRAINFLFRESVEHRVHEVLSEKLSIILNEFGVDKTSDVLDSEEGAKAFGAAYVEAILNPEKLEVSVDGIVNKIKEDIFDARSSSSILDQPEELKADEAKELMSHPLPHWVERMTINYTEAHNGRAVSHDGLWDLVLPDGTVFENTVFSLKEAEEKPESRHITIEEPRIRNIIESLARLIPGQIVPVVSIERLPKEVCGFWSLWQVELSSSVRKRQIHVPLFVDDEEKVLKPAANRIWNLMLTENPRVLRFLGIEESAEVYERLFLLAKKHGEDFYEELLLEHKRELERQIRRADYSFGARRRSIDRLGLYHVREHRLRVLMEEESRVKEQIEKISLAYPDMGALIIIRVES